MSVSGGPKIVTDGLLWYMDAKDYPGTGTTQPNLVDYTISGSFDLGTPAHSTTSNIAYFDFDGTDRLVLEKPFSGSIDMGVDFTYDVWATSGGGSSYRTLVDQDNDTRLLAVFSQSATPYELRFYNWNGPEASGYSMPSDDTIWFNIIAVQDTTGDRGLVCYRDGEIIYSDPSRNTGTHIPAQGMYISGPDERWVGKYAIARIYNRALTEKEVLQNFNANRGRFGL